MFLDRSDSQIEAKADELRRMAATATTAGVRDALLRLGERYAALREIHELPSLTRQAA